MLWRFSAGTESVPFAGAGQKDIKLRVFHLGESDAFMRVAKICLEHVVMSGHEDFDTQFSGQFNGLLLFI